MRKIETEMLHAVKNGLDWTSGNTSVFYISASESGNPCGARSEIYLHGNLIAEYWHDSGSVEVDLVTLKKWATNTTKSRLRALGVNVTTKNHVTFLNGEEV